MCETQDKGKENKKKEQDNRTGGETKSYGWYWVL